MRAVFVHGAWSCGEVWQGLSTQLRPLGWHIEAPTLPGQNQNDPQLGKVGLSDYVAALAPLIAGQPPAILVGHSFGGLSIAALSEAFPEQVRGALYVAAFLPQSGESLLDLVKTHGEAPIGRLRESGPVEGASFLRTPQAADMLFQDASDEERSFGLSCLRPQSNRPQVDGAELTQSRFGTVPREYVFCTDDLAVPPALQDAMLSAQPCQQVHRLDCGHFPQLTRTEALKDVISGFHDRLGAMGR